MQLTSAHAFRGLCKLIAVLGDWKVSLLNLLSKEKEKENTVRQNDRVIETSIITAHLQQGEESKTKGSFRRAIS